MRTGPLARRRRTPAFEVANPRVSLLALGDGPIGPELETLARTVEQETPPPELLLLGTPGQPQLGALVRSHPGLPCAVLQAPAEQPLGRRLNEGARRARGELLFVILGRGGIFPSTLTRLAAALAGDPQALFAYPMVGVFDAGEAVALAGSMPWEPERLRHGSWIDAMALIRREPLLALGGYTEDPRMAGWEAFELWCRCAEAGGHGVHVPQVLAWRERSDPAGTSDPHDPRWALLRERHPQLLGSR